MARQIVPVLDDMGLRNQVHMSEDDDTLRHDKILSALNLHALTALHICHCPFPPARDRMAAKKLANSLPC